MLHSDQLPAQRAVPPAKPSFRRAKHHVSPVWKTYRVRRWTRQRVWPVRQGRWLPSAVLASACRRWQRAIAWEQTLPWVLPAEQLVLLLGLAPQCDPTAAECWACRVVPVQVPVEAAVRHGVPLAFRFVPRFRFAEPSWALLLRSLRSRWFELLIRCAAHRHLLRPPVRRQHAALCVESDRGAVPFGVQSLHFRRAYLPRGLRCCFQQPESPSVPAWGRSFSICGVRLFLRSLRSALPFAPSSSCFSPRALVFLRSVFLSSRFSF